MNKIFVSRSSETSEAKKLIGPEQAPSEPKLSVKSKLYLVSHTSTEAIAAHVKRGSASPNHGGDSHIQNGYPEPMNDITREELNAKLEAIEVKMDARVQAVSAKIDSFLSAQVERDKAWEKISEARFDRIEKDVSSIKAESKKVAEDINGLKVTMAKYLGAAIVIGAVASAILGAAAKNLLGS
ncbi:hypothetical protein ACI2KG_00675 [Pseudomonas sp. NPDC089407]|uniref:hypothetical protein n=1 Tax=Pseudomonas sp. NPDC089407 TaxID=3364464 RepID=UPI00384EF48C